MICICLMLTAVYIKNKVYILNLLLCSMLTHCSQLSTHHNLLVWTVAQQNKRSPVNAIFFNYHSVCTIKIGLRINCMCFLFMNSLFSYGNLEQFAIVQLLFMFCGVKAVCRFQALLVPEFAQYSCGCLQKTTRSCYSFGLMCWQKLEQNYGKQIVPYLKIRSSCVHVLYSNSQNALYCSSTMPALKQLQTLIRNIVIVFALL